MLTQKSAFASTSWAQPSQLKRPRTAGTKSGKTRSWLIVKVVRRVVREELREGFREEWERVKSDLVECCQSSMENPFKEVMQQISSLKNAVPKLMQTVELTNDHSPHLGCTNAKTTGKNDVRNFRLHIPTKLSKDVFTGQKLEGECGARISVALIDADTGEVVKSGLESSIKLDVVVLKSDFNKDEEDNWAQEEFENYLVKEREGKGSLLTGVRQVTLKGGVGELGELIFMDNSSWDRNKRFRIGLKVASGYCGNTRIREAKTDAFRVKEHRGESNKKHYPPAFDDEVWRLEKIAKDGKSHQKLKEAGIHKVGDFLQHLSTDSKKLREVLGKSITQKNWESLKEHAKTCKSSITYLNNPNGKREHAAVFSTDHEPTGLIEDKLYFATDREKNHEDTIGKTSSSFPSQVSDQQTENPAPVQYNMAPSTWAPPVGPEAPLANAGSNADGHNDATSLPSSIESQDTMKDPANEARPPHQLRHVRHASDLISPFNCQATMPSHGIGSSSRMGCTSNENVSPPMSVRASMSSFPNGHNDVTAWPSSVQPQINYFENPMKCPAHGSAPLALRQPTPTECSSAPFSTAENAITATVSQFQDFPSRPTVPSHVTGSPSPMDYTRDGNVPPLEPRHDSSLSFQNGPPSESTSPFHYENLPDATRRRMFNHYEKMGCPVNELDHSSKALHAFPTEDDHMMEDLPSNAADNTTIFADLPNILSFDASTWDGGFFLGTRKGAVAGSR